MYGRPVGVVLWESKAPAELGGSAGASPSRAPQKALRKC